MFVLIAFLLLRSSQPLGIPVVPRESKPKVGQGSGPSVVCSGYPGNRHCSPSDPPGTAAQHLAKESRGGHT